MKRFAVTAVLVSALGVVPGAWGKGALSGSWTTTITGAKQLHGALNGTWVITFGRGAYRTFENGHPRTHGKNTINGHVITFSTAPGPYACPTKGTYRFRLTGKALTFKRIHDSTSGFCLAREIILKHKFTRAGG
jgi:hypothetical protein